MNSLTQYLVLLALLLSGAEFFATTQSQTRVHSRGSVAGKVTIKGKGASGIIVVARPSDPSLPFEPSIKATTNQDGRYQINEIPVGSYNVTPVAPAFLILNPSNSKIETVIVSEGESVVGVDFALARGGVITGKVTDADERPVVEQRVNLLAADLAPNQRQPASLAMTVETDDRGIYRMFGVPAGRYTVAVGSRPGSIFMGVSNRRSSYKQTFHPNTTDPTKAIVIEVTEGSEATNVDIALGHAMKTYAARGRVINGENGQPIANVKLGLQVIADSRWRLPTGISPVADIRGEFKIENLEPGEYAIFIEPEPDSDICADAEGFKVIDEDVNGIIIKTSKGASLSGSIVLDNTDNRVLARLMQLTVQGFVQGQNTTVNVGHSTGINPDGSFFLNGLETGTVHLLLGAPQDHNLLKGFVVSRVERDGLVQPLGIEVKDGDRITGVRVMISYGGTTVHGTVKLENGTLPPGGRIFVMVRKSGETPPNVRSPQVDGRGHFIMEGLAEGIYDFLAFVSNPRTPRQASGKREVSLSGDGLTEVVIAVDLNPKPTPQL